MVCSALQQNVNEHVGFADSFLAKIQLLGKQITHFKHFYIKCKYCRFLLYNKGHRMISSLSSAEYSRGDCLLGPVFTQYIRHFLGG